MPLSHIFLDMDGVLVDFVGGALALHGREDLQRSWPPGVWDIPTVMGIGASDFWRPIDRAGRAFWAGLAPYPWAGDLVRLTRQTAPLTILTSPGPQADCSSGKVDWLQRHVAPDFEDYLIGRPKHLCAAPHRVLIDDKDSNVDSFRQHGGAAILFPQRWNANHAIDHRLAYVASELRRLADTAASQPVTVDGGEPIDEIG